MAAFQFELNRHINQEYQEEKRYVAISSTIRSEAAGRSHFEVSGQRTFGSGLNKLTSYILRAVIGPFLFFLTALTALVWLSQSLRFVDLIINQNLPTSTFIYLSTLVLPGILVTIIPIALFAAIIFAYQRLLADSEIVVMWAAGIGNRQLTWPVLAVAIFAVALAYVFSLYLAPLGTRKLNNLRSDLSTDLSSLLLREGTFNTIGGTLTVYVRARQRNGEMLGILVHDSRDPKRPITMMAERGALVQAGDSARFVMVRGNRQEVDAASGRLSMLNFEKYVLDLSPYVKAHPRQYLRPKERFIHELLFPDENSAYDQRNREKLLARAHDRLSGPLYVLAFALIALACMLSGELRRRGLGRRIVVAFVLATALYLIGFAFRHLAGKSALYAIAVYLNLAIGIAIPTYILMRRKRSLFSKIKLPHRFAQ
jgi:lipopolysaccharide export system permease protein